MFEIATGVGAANLFATAIRGAIDLTKELVSLGLETQRQQNAFEAMTAAMGVSGKALASGLEQASRGLADVSDNMTATVRALQAGLSPEQTINVMKIATAQAELMGTTVTAAYNQITTAIVNNQEKALKGMGIMADLTGAQRAYAATLSTTANNLTDQQKSLVSYNAVVEATAITLETLGNKQLTASQQAEKASVAYQNLKEDLGVGFVTGIGNLVLSIEDSTTALDQWSQKAATAYVGFGANVAAARDAILGLGKAFASSDGDIDKHNVAIRDANLAWKDGEVNIVGLGDKILTLGTNAAATAAALKAMATGMEGAFAGIQESLRKAAIIDPIAKAADDILDKFRQLAPRSSRPWNLGPAVSPRRKPRMTTRVRRPRSMPTKLRNSPSTRKRAPSRSRRFRPSSRRSRIRPIRPGRRSRISMRKSRPISNNFPCWPINSRRRATG